MARIEPVRNAPAGREIQRRGVGLPGNDASETFLVILRDDEVYSRRALKRRCVLLPMATRCSTCRTAVGGQPWPTFLLDTYHS